MNIAGITMNSLLSGKRNILNKFQFFYTDSRDRKKAIKGNSLFNKNCSNKINMSFLFSITVSFLLSLGGHLTESQKVDQYDPVYLGRHVLLILIY